ncbi:hypothetical protein BC936DRAFT_142148 [Jimgerdemannia flammicorona]|uniref:Uncharacterized protein n=1 Tax=Jimgerdemannia flammicorona TaxID=994334 RepID=A0A433A0V5_9FUNG|nr:hypothetical protein BC936DRAFT_142148 [Jimgerdemannia flammicorona]
MPAVHCCRPCRFRSSFSSILLPVELGHSGSIPADARCGIARHLVNPTKRPTRQSVRGPADTRGDDHILRVDLSAHVQ